jgi:serine/threonine protein kinase
MQVGRYRVLKELGRGATGVVYAAVDPAIGRTVAIKTIRLDISLDRNLPLCFMEASCSSPARSRQS